MACVSTDEAYSLVAEEGQDAYGMEAIQAVLVLSRKTIDT